MAMLPLLIGKVDPPLLTRTDSVPLETDVRRDYRYTRRPSGLRVLITLLANPGTYQ